LKIAVYAHSMEIGGSQMNAIEIGAAVQRLGHEVVLVAEPGPLLDVARRLGLEHQPIPLHRRRPSFEVVATLVRLARRRGFGIFHGYEWVAALEGYLGPAAVCGATAVGTVMSSDVAPFLPRSLPLVVGTDALRRTCLARGYELVRLLEPPVDVDANSPDFDGSAFRASLGIGSAPLVVVVCRLVPELKREGLLAACRTFGELGREAVSARLVIVGDGPARAEVEAEAARANARAGKPVVQLTGELADPRPAYAAADVILGMGGSALRGMAFGKPLVVQGELGFWQVCDPDSLAQFLDGGWYGLGDGSDGAPRLRAQLLPLLLDAERRAALGSFARKLIVERFSLRQAARVQVSVYEEALERGRRPRVTELARIVFPLARYKVGRRFQRLRGAAAADDFNVIQKAGG